MHSITFVTHSYTLIYIYLAFLKCTTFTYITGGGIHSLACTTSTCSHIHLHSQLLHSSHSLYIHSTFFQCKHLVAFLTAAYISLHSSDCTFVCISYGGGHFLTFQTCGATRKFYAFMHTDGAVCSSADSLAYCTHKCTFTCISMHLRAVALHDSADDAHLTLSGRGSVELLNGLVVIFLGCLVPFAFALGVAVRLNAAGANRLLGTYGEPPSLTCWLASPAAPPETEWRAPSLRRGSLCCRQQRASRGHTRESPCRRRPSWMG